MSNPARLLRSYFFWTYERGSFHYDVMVTLILLFLFIAPRFINFKDRPVADIPPAAPAGPRPSRRLLRRRRTPHLHRALLDLHGATGAALQAAAMQIIQPIAGPVTFERITPVQDTKGHTVAYDVTVADSSARQPIRAAII